MNSWNFNELTQQDVLDYKACQRQDGSIYGVPDKSECQKGKEISKDQINELAIKASKGDKKARATLDKVVAENKKVKDKERADKEAEKKRKAQEGDKKKKGKGKKGGGKKGGGKGKKGGAGKKGGGGKGKGGSAKGGGSSKQVSAQVRQRQQEAQKNRQDRQRAMRKRLQDLQASLRKVKNPAVKKALEESINDLMKGVAELSKATPGGDTAAKPEGKTPAAPTGEVTKPKNEKE